MNLLNKKTTIGNTFNKGEVKFGHSRKVWREQREVLPAGGVIENVEDFVAKGMIPTGRPVIFDDKAKTMIVLTKEMVLEAAESGSMEASVEAFSEAKTYAVGDKVKKGAQYYECVNAVEEAGEFDAADWQEIEVSEIKLEDINGYLKEDAPIEDENTVATGTVVVDGDIYEYMFDEQEAAILKALPQKNGMKIRFVN